MNETVKCECGAVVGVGTRWLVGEWIGTSGHFDAHYRIEAGKCPMCRRELKSPSASITNINSDDS